MPCLAKKALLGSGFPAFPSFRPRTSTPWGRKELEFGYRLELGGESEIFLEFRRMWCDAHVAVR